MADSDAEPEAQCVKCGCILSKPAVCIFIFLLSFFIMRKGGPQVVKG